MAGRQILVPNADRKEAAAPCDHARILEMQLQLAQSDLETGGAAPIASQRVRHPHRVGIERAAQGNAGLPKAGAPKVLHRGKETGRTNEYFHADHLSNSSREIRRKRTRSPA